MWVDIFPGDVNPLPAPIDISPRKPIDIELRVIVYDVYNIVSSEKKPDVYVQAELPGLDSKIFPVQRTDVHKNVSDKRARFNYRMVFSNL